MTSEGSRWWSIRRFAIEQYLEAAAEDGVRIERVLETHTHADHLSGHGRFALEHGVPVAIHALAEAEYPHEPLTDGQLVEVGGTRIRVLHTPGHRPEHCAFVVDERIVLTGDSMFVGDAARPDLAVDAREGAVDLFHSLARLAELPEGVEVYPGHVAGSLCGANMSPDRSSTIGKERKTNHALEFHDVQEFVLVSASVSTPRPPTTEHVVALNRGPWVPEPEEPTELSDRGEATVLDVRPFTDYTEGHVPGSISVPVSGGVVRDEGRLRARARRTGRAARAHAGRGARGGPRALGGRYPRPGGLRRPPARDGAARDRGHLRLG